MANPGQEDFDNDGQGDVCDADDDNDGVPDAQDADPLDRFVCRDVDADTCDDCTSGTSDPSNDGTDTDGDGLCDVGDADDDGDGIPDTVDPCPLDPTNSCNCTDTDGDGICDDDDNCPLAVNPAQQDTDADGIGDVCDNCPGAFNPEQHDSDGDAVGDACDPDTGTIDVILLPGGMLEWHSSQAFTDWNLYRSDLDVLRLTGSYTQEEGSSPLAMRICGVGLSWFQDFEDPPAGKTAFYLVTGMNGGIEGSLGPDGSGQVRPNPNPCVGVSEQTLCVQSGGVWDPGSCGHYPCGQFPDCDAIIPGCDCGPGRNFGPGGCFDDASCP